MINCLIYRVTFVSALSLLTNIHNFAMATVDNNIPKNSKQVVVFFTLTAAQATLTADPEKKPLLTLTLQNVNPETIWFSDRPDRISGDINTTAFMQIWNQPGKNSYAELSPNATLIAVQDINGVKTQVHDVFTVSDPHYNSEQKTLTYTVQGIHDHDLPRSLPLEQPVLFFDSMQCPRLICH